MLRMVAFWLTEDSSPRFYKEEKVGETHNYVHKTASCQGQSALAVLEATVSETCAAYRRTQSIFKNVRPYDEVWHEYVMGYVTMHVNMPRYKLAEIGVITDDYPVIRQKTSARQELGGGVSRARRSQLIRAKVAKWQGGLGITTLGDNRVEWLFIPALLAILLLCFSKSDLVEASDFLR